VSEHEASAPPTVAVDDPDAVARAADALRAGGAVVLPTDTVYGLAALPGHEDVLAVLKDRPAEMPIAVLIAEPTTMPLPASATRLAAAFWPGPLTLLVPGDDGATVGLRCPDHDFVRALARRVGPLPTTSANKHGEPTARAAADAAASLVRPPALVVDGGACGDLASTVVDCTGARVVVAREGAVPERAIVAALS
jgi:tRNA threonylcarbamoyl adenosine modification protein (Sua5/YciO/YrdC/YwlC family)